jgi:hypothetical protein
MYTVCGGGVWGSGPQTDKHLPESHFTGQFVQMTTFCIAFSEFYLSTGSDVEIIDNGNIM